MRAIYITAILGAAILGAVGFVMMAGDPARWSIVQLCGTWMVLVGCAWLNDRKAPR